MIPVFAHRRRSCFRRIDYGRRAACAIAMMTVLFSVPVVADRSKKPNQAPNVTLSSPSNGATFQAPASIAVTANANDPDGSIVQVDFYAGSTFIGSDTRKPFTTSWSNIGAGTYALTAVARDNNGAASTSAPLTVVVTAAVSALPPPDATAPTVSVTAPVSGAQVSGSVTITAGVSDNVGVTSVTVLVDGVVIGSDTASPFTAMWNASGATQGAHSITARAVDAAGNIGTSAPVTVNVVPPADTTVPTVSITSPTNGASVTGIVAVSVAATDNVAVTSVSILVDGTSVGSDAASPYTVNWNTAGLVAGAHTLRAQARDAAGNIGTSSNISLTVVAANQPPTITLTAPANGTSYTTPATITVSATAGDADGTVSRIDFFVGTTLIASDSTSPYSVTWTATAAGTYSFSATAVDNTGATTVSPSASVTVTGASTSTAKFSPSADDAIVQSYRLDIFPSTANVAAASPTASKDLGKPQLVSGEYVADISTTLTSLPTGSYVATVSAVSAASSARSAPSPVFSVSAAVTATGLGLSSAGAALSSAEPSPEASRAPSAGADGVVWVSNSATDIVVAFDATTGDVLGTVAVGLKPSGIAVSRSAGRIYVADEGSDTVSVVDKASLSVVATIALPRPSGRRPRFASSSPEGSSVYIGEAGSNVVDVIDTASNRLTSRFAGGQPGSTIRGAVTDSTGQVLYTISAGDQPSLNVFAAIEAATGRWLWAVPLEDQPGGLTIAADDRAAFVAIPATNGIRTIDLARGSAIADVDLGSGNEPDAIQSSPDGNVVVTLGGGGQRVAIVDGGRVRMVSSGQLTSTTWVADNPHHLSYLGVSDGGGEAVVIAIDPTRATVVHRFRFPGGGVPETAVFDPR